MARRLANAGADFEHIPHQTIGEHGPEVTLPVHRVREQLELTSDVTIRTRRRVL